MSTSTSIDTCPSYEEMSPDIPPSEIEMGGTTLATVIDQIERLRALFESKFPNLSIKLKTAGKYFSVLSSFLHKTKEINAKYAPKIILIAQKTMYIAQKIICFVAKFACANPVLSAAILTMMITLITETCLIVSKSRQSTTIGGQKKEILQLQKQIQELTQARDEAIACANSLGNKRDEALKNSKNTKNASQASSATKNQTTAKNNPGVNIKNTTPNGVNSTTIDASKSLNNTQTKTGITARLCKFAVEFIEDLF